MSTLHLTDSTTTVGATQCVHVASQPAQSDAITVSFAGSPAQWLDDWQDKGGSPRRATVVTGDAAAWLAGHPRDRLESAVADDTDVRVELVDSPRNLTDLGVTLTQLLETHGERAPPTTLCLRSLTVLLQYSESDAVYRFLHTLLGHLDQFDISGHFHLHAAAHAEDVIASFEPLFDRVVRDADN